MRASGRDTVKLELGLELGWTSAGVGAGIRLELVVKLVYSCI